MCPCVRVYMCVCVGVREFLFHPLPCSEFISASSFLSLRDVKALTNDGRVKYRDQIHLITSIKYRSNALNIRLNKTFQKKYVTASTRRLYLPFGTASLLWSVQVYYTIVADTHTQGRHPRLPSFSVISTYCRPGFLQQIISSRHFLSYFNEMRRRSCLFDCPMALSNAASSQIEKQTGIVLHKLKKKHTLASLKSLRSFTFVIYHNFRRSKFSSIIDWLIV